MNEHIKNKHMGRRFICPVCSIDCTATSSLERHMKHFHQVEKEPNTSLTEHEHFVAGEEIVLSQDALLAKIKNLEKTLEAKNKEIADLKKTLKKPQKKK